MTHDSLKREFSTLRPDLQGDWDQEKSERELARLKARLERGQTRGGPAVAALAVAALLLVAFGAFFLLQAEHSSPRMAPAPIVLNDGSEATPLAARTQMRVLQDDPGHVVVELEQGQARFKVTPNPSRLFSVRAAGTTVEVLGTTFEVTHQGGDQVHVHVSEGLVRVSRQGEVTMLRAHDSVTVGGGKKARKPRDMPTAPAPPEEALSFELEEVAFAKEPTPQKPPRPQAPKPPEDKGDWRLMAKAQDFQSAVILLLKSPVEPKTVEDLMLAADAMRSVERFDQAMRYHQKVISSYPQDPRASLAAHHLGRTLLNKLHRPAQAARAFAKVQTLNPPRTLAEDALAAEVEAWHEAGDSAQAKRQALTYLERYPGGLHVRKIRRFGGLD